MILKIFCLALIYMEGARVNSLNCPKASDFDRKILLILTKMKGKYLMSYIDAKKSKAPYLVDKKDPFLRFCLKRLSLLKPNTPEKTIKYYNLYCQTEPYVIVSENQQIEAKYVDPAQDIVIDSKIIIKDISFGRDKLFYTFTFEGTDFIAKAAFHDKLGNYILTNHIKQYGLSQIDHKEIIRRSKLEVKDDIEKALLVSKTPALKEMFIGTCFEGKENERLDMLIMKKANYDLYSLTEYLFKNGIVSLFSERVALYSKLAEFAEKIFLNGMSYCDFKPVNLVIDTANPDAGFRTHAESLKIIDFGSLQGLDTPCRISTNPFAAFETYSISYNSDAIFIDKILLDLKVKHLVNDMYRDLFVFLLSEKNMNLEDIGKILFGSPDQYIEDTKKFFRSYIASLKEPDNMEAINTYEEDIFELSEDMEKRLLKILQTFFNNTDKQVLKYYIAASRGSRKADSYSIGVTVAYIELRLVEFSLLKLTINEFSLIFLENIERLFDSNCADFPIEEVKEKCSNARNEIAEIINHVKAAEATEGIAPHSSVLLQYIVDKILVDYYRRDEITAFAAEMKRLAKLADSKGGSLII